jgi:hypothetical protein
MVRFDGTNGPDIAALVGDPRLCRWDGYELTVHNEQGWFVAAAGDPLLMEADDTAIYPMPRHRFPVQYRIVGEWS